MTDTLTVISVLVAVFLAAFGGFYALLRAEMGTLKAEISGLRREMTSDFKRLELLLELHEARHHPEIQR